MEFSTSVHSFVRKAGTVFDMLGDVFFTKYISDIADPAIRLMRMCEYAMNTIHCK